jgi:hypothetical protein
MRFFLEIGCWIHEKYQFWNYRPRVTSICQVDMLTWQVDLKKSGFLWVLSFRPDISSSSQQKVGLKLCNSTEKFLENLKITIEFLFLRYFLKISLNWLGPQKSQFPGIFFSVTRYFIKFPTKSRTETSYF